MFPSIGDDEDDDVGVVCDEVCGCLVWFVSSEEEPCVIMLLFGGDFVGVSWENNLRACLLVEDEPFDVDVAVDEDADAVVVVALEAAAAKAALLSRARRMHISDDCPMKIIENWETSKSIR